MPVFVVFLFLRERGKGEEAMVCGVCRGPYASAINGFD